MKAVGFVVALVVVLLSATVSPLATHLTGGVGLTKLSANASSDSLGSQGLIDRLKAQELKAQDADESRSLVVTSSDVTLGNGRIMLRGKIRGRDRAKAQLRISGELAEVSDNGSFAAIIKGIGSTRASHVVDIEVLFPDGEKIVQHYTVGTHLQGGTGDVVRSKLFYPNRADSLALGTAMLKVDSGAVKQPLELSLQAVSESGLPNLPSGMVNVTPGGGGLRFLPHGEHFVRMASVAIPFDSLLIPQGYTAKDIRTFYFNEHSQRWEQLPYDTLKRARQLVLARTTHFTDMINGVIKVPESPQTAAYTSTTLTDIKAADPGAGITRIASPTAQQSGTASISYPFSLPAGRAGMTPSLGLQYSNEGGSSWVGLGWSLSVPSIELETRWGVPHFDVNTETETYLLAGEQLAPMAYRESGIARTSEKRFYPRTEGSFARIIRHGDSPKSYWWEITDKSGGHSYFGGLPDGGASDSFVIKDADGNISSWVLALTVDRLGNSVQYTYEKQGNLLYLSLVSYTGYKNEKGHYSVELVKAPDSENIRKDKVVSARTGVLVTDEALLGKVRVLLDGEVVKSYTLNYQEGAFAKTLLKSITESDAKGEEEHTHTFEYYNDIKNGLYGKKESWAVGSDFSSNLFETIKAGFEGNRSALNTSSSFGSSAGGGVMIGAGYGTFVASAGPSYQTSNSSTEGEVTIIDINGDGLPDKVVKVGDQVYYRPNLLGVKGKTAFGDRIPINIDGFSSGSNEGYTLSGNVSLGLYSFTVGLSKSSGTSTSTTKRYLSDFNGDGLPDLASNGKVFFNTIDANGKPDFTLSSGNTPNPIRGSSAIDAAFIPDYDAEQKEQEKQHPLHDMVRMWRAPFAGTVEITGAVRLTVSAVDWSKYGKCDGVAVSIQKEGSLLWSEKLSSAGASAAPGSVGSINVKEGDRLFFRVNSIYDGAYDEVEWSPQIRYTTTLPQNSDANKLSLSSYSCASDFVPGRQDAVVLPNSGIAHIRAPYAIQPVSDSLTLCITKISKGDTSTLASRTIAPMTFASGDMGIPISVAAQDSVLIRFDILCRSNVNQRLVSWKPEVDIPGTDTKEITTMQVVPYFASFNKVVVVAAPFTIEKMKMAAYHTERVPVRSGAKDSIKVYDVRMLAHIKVADENSKGVASEVYFSIKGDSGIVYRKRYTLNGSRENAAKDTITVRFREDQAGFYPEFFVRSEAVSGTLGSLELVDGSKEKLPVWIHSTFNRGEYGPLYRGWGGFAYLGGTVENRDLIKPELLGVKDDEYEGVVNSDGKVNEEMLNAMKPINEQPFFSLSYNGGEHLFTSVTSKAYMTDRLISSSRMGRESIVVERMELNTGNDGLSALNKRNKTTTAGTGISGGVNLFKKLGIGLSDGKSESKDVSEVDMIDLNGDRFPDPVFRNGKGVKVQYTDAGGKPTSFSLVHNLSAPVAVSKSSCDGIEVSKTLPKRFTSIFSGVKSKDQASAATAANRQAEASASVGGNFSKGSDEVVSSWNDINGDGLPDMLYSDGRVQLNLGYKFSDAINWSFDAIRKGSSTSWGAGSGINIPVAGEFAITAGVNASYTKTKADEVLTDINGDGLPDMVDMASGKVAVNTGSGLAPYMSWEDVSEESKATSWSRFGGTAFTFPIPLIFIQLQVSVNVDIASSKGLSRVRSQLCDIDGDGYPDMLYSDNDDDLTVRRSLIGRTNMLQSVSRPLGGKTTLEYSRVGNTYSMPQSKWVLSAVSDTITPSGNGAAALRTSFSYDNGYYDRYERMFFGFGTVKTTQHDTQNGRAPYRTSTVTYDNRHYHTRNLVLESNMADAAATISRSYNRYELRKVDGSDVSRFPALTETKSETMEAAGAPVMVDSSRFAYDSFGNVVFYRESGSDASDWVESHVSYHSLPERYLMSIPREQQVVTQQGVMRVRSTEVDGLGNIVKITQSGEGVAPAIVDLTYDGYGNLTKLTRPANYKGERLWYAYTYDDKLHQLPAAVEDSYGYRSTTEYDLRWGTPTKTTDINGELMRYTYDSWGRLTSVTAPYELKGAKSYTLQMEYHADAAVPYAITRHRLDDSGELLTYTFTDALGRPIQVKKSASVWEDGNAKQVMVVSGRQLYDAFGRVTAAFHPTVEEPGNEAAYSTATDNVEPTRTTYDTRDRALSVTLPDGATTTNGYKHVEEQGNVMLQETTTDALGRVAVTLTDSKERKRLTRQKAAHQEVTVRMDYNAIGELLTVHHPNETRTHYEYDRLGRKLSVSHPDAGTTIFTYDPAGNLLTRQTQELRQTIKAGGEIRYTYDYERPSEVLYPKNLFNRVTYHYGAPTDTMGRAGRLTFVEDASGGEEYFYGAMGEITKTVRTLMISPTDMRTYIWETEHDSWGRIRTMAYPDGEKVTYGYDRSGQLVSMAGVRGSEKFSYLQRQGYDKFGQLVYRQLGNGTETRYTYDPKLRLLSTMNLTNAKGTLMHNTYRYDAVQNILGISNTAKGQALGGVTDHSYRYDELNRLVAASGNYSGKDTATYTLAMRYDIMSNPLQKKQAVVRRDTSKNTLTHNLIYTYGGAKPNAPQWIGSAEMSYDGNGNPTQEADTAAKTTRRMLWDEENRLTMLSDDGFTSRYVYNHSGERAIKVAGGTKGVFVNGAPQGVIDAGDNSYTLYVSPYMVVKGGGFTKHYYAGTQRIVSKIGTGTFDNLFKPARPTVTAGGKNYIAKYWQMVKEREEYYHRLGIPPGPPTMQGVNGEPENTGTAYTNAPLGSYDVPKSWPTKPKFADAGGPPGPPVQWNKKDLTSDNAQAGDGYTNSTTTPENEEYFYHPDHLGSTSYITDHNGGVVQFACYLPYGEALADEHTVTSTQPYKFSGKELDGETGLYYFGARYYNPRFGTWYGVDALAEKAFAVSAYCYAFSSPVNLTDPDGRWPKPSLGFKLGFNLGIGSNGVNFNVTASAGVELRTPNFQSVAFASGSIYGGQQLGTSSMTSGLQYDLMVGAYATIGNGTGSAHNFYTLNYNTASPFDNTFDVSLSYGQARTLNSAINARGDGPGWQTQGIIGARLGENFSLSSNNDANSYGTGLIFNDKGSDAGWTGGIVLNVGGFEVGYQNFSGYWPEFGSEGLNYGHKFSAESRTIGNGVYHQSLNKAFNFGRKENFTGGIYSGAWFQNWIHKNVSNDGTYIYNNQGNVNTTVGQ